MKPARAFTLIESIIYLALFGILIGGAVVAAFNIFEASGHEQTRAEMQEEGNFIMGKINWAISGSQSVNSPSVYGSQLSVNKVTDLVAGVPVITPVVIGISGTDVTIQEGTQAASILNNTNVQIIRLGFMHTAASGNGLNPESVEASTTLAARTPNGMLLTQTFTSTVYIRR